MERYSVSLRIQSEFGKIQARKTLNTDTFHAVLLTSKPGEAVQIAIAVYQDI